MKDTADCGFHVSVQEKETIKKLDTDHIYSKCAPQPPTMPSAPASALPMGQAYHICFVKNFPIPKQQPTNFSSNLWSDSIFISSSWDCSVDYLPPFYQVACKCSACPYHSRQTSQPPKCVWKAAKWLCLSLSQAPTFNNVCVAQHHNLPAQILLPTALGARATCSLKYLLRPHFIFFHFFLAWLWVCRPEPAPLLHGG